MNDFPIIPVNPQSVSARKKVLGVGVNDADYLIRPTVGGKRLMCPFYQVWQNMIKRSYSNKYLASQPTYIGVSVCDEWRVFSKFRKWMEKQDWHGKQLDKDLLVQGNKIYSPETCIFVTRDINVLLTDSGSARGEHKIGVHYSKKVKKYLSICSVNGKQKILGRHSTEVDAHESYKKFKYDLIRKVALEQSEPLRSALLNYRIPEY